jgi:hypothetical protein
VRLSATRAAGAPYLTLKGTATDRNFESYEITARNYPSGTATTVVARSTQPVRQGTLAEWTPTAPGMYELTLTARDKAGNVRSRSTKVVWSSAPALANLWREPEFLSPNGDGVQDSSVLHYTTTIPYEVGFDLVSSSGEVVRKFRQAHEAPGNFSLTWDGRNDEGVIVPDDVYVARTVAGSLRFVVDTTPPELMLRFSDTLPVSGPPGPGNPDFAKFAQGWREAIVQPDNQPVQVPFMALAASWRSRDANLQGGVLERSALQSPVDFADLRAADGSQYIGEYLRLQDVRGRYLRLRAWDKAGNEAVLSPSMVPERLFVLAVGDAE